MLGRSRWGEFFVLFLAVVLGVVFAGLVGAASPRLSNIQPRGVQRGVEHTLTLNGNNLGDAQEIFFYEEGFEVLEVKGEGNKATVKVKVAADCRLGEHVAQVRTASGISDYRTLYGEDLPVIAETEPNSDFDTPQEISLNHVINGTISNEDVDYYVVDVKKGQRLTAEIVAMRLSTANFDPYVAILDEKRFELATNDDTALALQDGFASIIAPADGKYTVEVRESAYAAGSNYRLHVGTFPRPKVVFPAGGKMGDEVEIKYLGIPTGDLTDKIKLPPSPVTDFGLVAVDDGGTAPTANNFRLFPHGNAFESEPNNNFDVASPVELPLAFNGVIDTPGDVDFYKFAAKKGQVFEVECFARRIRSGLDPVLNIYKADKGNVVGNDDSRGPDSYVRFTVPADGEYFVRVTDHLGRGGPDLVYRVEFEPVQPKLTLGIPRTERYGQYRQQIFVPKGNRFGTIISATRSNFGGELKLLGENLPPGITMHCVNMPANQNTMPVVFEATADAQLNGALIDFLATHADPNQKITGGFRNRADYIIAGPGQSLYRWKDVDRLAMAVIDEIPFKIDVVEPKVPIVRDGSMQVKVVVTKKDGWDEQISVQFPYRSPGLGASSSVNIPKGQNEVLYPINANGNAEIKEWKFYVLGSS
ncbi:MAG: peptidase, partial [Pirellulaceae bacterium]|nr:peptidase [Pirellulaceae bacterium]